MTKVLVTAQVEDAVKWEEGFRTHADLFKKYTVNKPVNFSVKDNNEVAVNFEPDDLDKCLAMINSPETAEAMAFDGVKRDTVKIYVLDKEYKV